MLIDSEVRADHVNCVFVVDRDCTLFFQRECFKHSSGIFRDLQALLDFELTYSVSPLPHFKIRAEFTRITLGLSTKFVVSRSESPSPVLFEYEFDCVLQIEEDIYDQHWISESLRNDLLCDPEVQMDLFQPTSLRNALEFYMACDTIYSNFGKIFPQLWSKFYAVQNSRLTYYDPIAQSTILSQVAGPNATREPGPTSSDADADSLPLPRFPVEMHIVPGPPNRVQSKLCQPQNAGLTISFGHRAQDKPPRQSTSTIERTSHVLSLISRRTRPSHEQFQVYCRSCHEGFGLVKDMYRHLSSHCPALPFRPAEFLCDGCGGMFSRADALKRHQERYIGKQCRARNKAKFFH